MSNSPLVSVIIPVYNVEKYLEKCLDSIVNQTLKDIEIICVNDGSTDNSLNILEKYQQKDDRIKIITQENQGAGVARNQGLKVAKGKYLSILDSDDFFDLDMLELMYGKALETDADVTICRADRYNNSTGNFEDMSWSLKDSFLPDKEVFNYRDIKKHIFDFAIGWSWDKLFKSSFVFENNLEFQDLRSTNDMLFVFLSLVKAKKITIVDKILAHHRVNVITSLSRTREEDPLCFYDAIKALKEDLIKSNLFSEVEQSFVNWSLHFCFWHVDTNSKSEHILSELKNRIFKELEFYKYPKSYFYDEKLYNRLMSTISADLIYKKRKFDKLLSFLYILKKEKLNPRNIYKIYKARGQINSLNLFDDVYYLTNYLDVRNSNVSPLDHYIYHGWKEKRNPSKKFDGNYYLRKYSDVRKSKTNPLVHYVLYGKEEGRFPNRQVEMNSPQNVGKKFLDRIKNLEKSLSQSNKKIKKLENCLKFRKYLSELDELHTLRTINSFLSKFQRELKKAKNNNELDYSLFNSVEVEAFEQIIKDPRTFYIKNYVHEEEYEEYLADWYFYKTGNKLNLKNPISFNEKIQWLKLYDSTLFKTELSDKYLVRE